MSTTTVSSNDEDDAASPWWAIPRLAGRLLVRHWPELLFWFFLQRVSYDLLMDAATSMGGTSLLLSYAALAVLVATQLAAVIAMFLCLRPSLPVLSRRDVPRAPAAGNPWLRALTVALLPFFAYYTTWGLLDGLRRQFQMDYLSSVDFAHQVSPRDVLHLPWLWVALLVSALIRQLSKRRAESSQATGTLGAGWPLLATICEAYWVFVGARAIAQVIGMGWDWWHDRVAYAVLLRWWDDPRALFHLLAPLKHMLLPMWDWLTTAFGGAVLPLVWLAITAIVYGMDLKRAQPLDAADQRFAAVGTRYSALPLLVRKLAGKASAGWTSKGVPVTNSLRLVLRAGLPAAVVLCVGYQALELLDSWAWRGVVHLLGPHADPWWNIYGNPISALVGGPLSTRPSLLTEPLQVVLLAATFDCAIARLRGQATQAAAVSLPSPATT